MSGQGVSVWLEKGGRNSESKSRPLGGLPGVIQALTYVPRACFHADQFRAAVLPDLDVSTLFKSLIRVYRVDPLPLFVVPPADVTLGY